MSNNYAFEFCVGDKVNLRDYLDMGKGTIKEIRVLGSKEWEYMVEWERRKGLSKKTRHHADELSLAD